MNRFALCLVLLWMTATAFAASTPTPFFLHDGDRVVFYGDSITEQQMYARDVETFTLTHYPSLHVHFINSGWSGDTVQGGGGGKIDLRLTRDVINYKPTVVTVFLGMNDGGYQTYDENRFQTYAQGLTHIVDRLTREIPGVRLTLLTPSYFDYAAKPRDPQITPNAFHDPAPDYNATLLRYGDFVKRLGAIRHIPVVDTNAPMAAATVEGRRSNPDFNLFQSAASSFGDGVHPNGEGHGIIAKALLIAWHASSIPLPQNAQARDVQTLVQKRIDTWHEFWKGKTGGIARRSDVPTEAELSLLRTEDTELNGLRDQARTAAQPMP